MSYETYKTMHIVGLILLFMGLGTVLLSPRSEGSKPPKAGMIMHGIGLVVILVAGFGLLARLGMSWPWPVFVIAKIAIWVALAMMPMLVKRGALPAAIGWAVAAALGGAAAYLAFTKPWM